jgi:hypothetical protein
LAVSDLEALYDDSVGLAWSAANVLDKCLGVVSDNGQGLVLQTRCVPQRCLPPLREGRSADQVSIGLGIEPANTGRRMPAFFSVQMHQAGHVVCVEVVNPPRCDGSRCGWSMRGSGFH